MVIVTDPAKPFQLTAKGTPRRQVSLNLYSVEIDALYKRVEESAQVDVSPPDAWDEEGTRGFVRDVVSKVMRAPNIGDDEDLFQQGCDRCALSAEVVTSHSVRLM